ncbi:unnamed protein product, partial [Rotaria sp. Silwood1]
AAQSYYVTISGNDGNLGTTQSNAWRTIQKAASKATPGSTVYIGPGTYYETVTILVQGNATSGPITFTSLNPNIRPIISGARATVASSDGTLNLIYMQNKSYLRFVNLELTNLTKTECSGIRIVGGGTQIELRNLLIHHIRGGGETGGAMAITVYNKDQTKSRSGLIIDNCTLHDCQPAWSEALTLNGNVEQFQITNNRVYNMNNIGIDFIGGEIGMGALGARSGRCANNTVWNIHSVYDSSAAGIYVDGGSNITVEMNEVHHSDAGIEIGAENKGRIASKMTVRKNYIHHNDKVGLAFGGYDQNRGRVINSLFEANRLEYNDAKSTGSGEIVVSYASNNSVYLNIVKPSTKNIILYADPSGGLKNVFDRQIYYPNGVKATQNAAQSYYVTISGNDGNLGTTQSNAWRSIQKAASQAIPGSTVYIGPGTYYETVTILVQGDATSGPITFTSLDPNIRPIISGARATVASSDGTLNLIYMENKSYLRFVNLELTNLTNTECSGIRIIGGGTQIELRNLLIHRIRGGGETGGAMAITVYNKDQTKSRSGLIIDSCTLHDCQPAWSEALTLNGNVEQFQITNNRVYNMNNIGIDFIGMY